MTDQSPQAVWMPPCSDASGCQLVPEASRLMGQGPSAEVIGMSWFMPLIAAMSWPLWSMPAMGSAA